MDHRTEKAGDRQYYGRHVDASPRTQAPAVPGQRPGCHRWHPHHRGQPRIGNQIQQVGPRHDRIVESPGCHNRKRDAGKDQETLMAAAGLEPERQADDCEHCNWLDYFHDVTGDGSLPLHAVEFIADWPWSQYGRAVHAAAVCAGTTGKLVRADREHATSAGRIGG